MSQWLLPFGTPAPRARRARKSISEEQKLARIPAYVWTAYLGYVLQRARSGKPRPNVSFHCSIFSANCRAVPAQVDLPASRTNFYHLCRLALCHSNYMDYAPLFKFLYLQHLSVLERMVSVSRGTSSDSQTTWCKIANPLTKGFCFLPEDDRIQTIEFIDSHTRPGSGTLCRNNEARQNICKR